MLVVGGDFRSGDPGLDDRVEIFDPAQNVWSAAAYHEGIGSHRDSILLNDGTGLVHVRTALRIRIFMIRSATHGSLAGAISIRITTGHHRAFTGWSSYGHRRCGIDDNMMFFPSGYL